MSEIQLSYKDRNELLDFCSDIIKVYQQTGRLLYRGSQKNVEYNTINYIVPRKDRRPTNTNERIHTAIDNAFYKKFGWRARSEGVFATSSVDETVLYGSPCVFFPYDNFDFVWSPEVVDMFVTVEQELYEEEDAKELVELYQETDIIGAVKSKSEIMFRCPAYYLVPLGRRWKPDDVKQLLDSLKT